MGSDLYLEQRSFRPGPPRVSWVDRKTILVETEVFYHGYREFYRGPLTPEIKQVLTSLGIKDIPPLPKMSDEELATVLHDMLCQWNHADGCGWYYETDPDTKWTKGRAHGSYLAKAQKLIKQLPDMSPDDIIKVAKTVKSL